MRRKSLLNFIFGLLILAGTGLAQAQITVMDWGQQWRYLITNALPTGGWSASNYPAQAGWPIGAAPLSYSGTGHEPMPSGVPNSVTLLATNFNNTFVTSFYFRTSITLNTNPNNLIITGTAVVDDGAVIYVNGREVQRLGVTNTIINVVHTTTANRGGEVTDAGRVESFTIPSSNFVQGANVIAASVHQNNGTSSDVAWAMRITAQVVLPIAITQQPQDQEVELGQRGTFSVVATGSNPQYRWYSNNVAILPLNTATNSTFQTPVVTAGMNGIVYHVVVSNSMGSVRSSNAVLTVVQDTSGPVMRMITQWPGESNAFRVDFSEGVTQVTAENESNYVVHIFGTTNTLSVTQASWGGTYVRLRLNGVIDPTSNYVVCTYGLRDSRSNITTSDCLGASFNVTRTLLTVGEVWRYDENAALVGPPTADWMTRGYNDDPFTPPFHWFQNPAPFHEDQTGGPVRCTPQLPPEGTLADRSPVTIYYRKWIDVGPTPLPANVSIMLRHEVDDGAVFYLNGTEIHRVNMPAGLIAYETRATAARDGNCTTDIITNRGNLFVTGTNLIAVEVHQATEALVDVWFDMELTVSYPRTITFPELTITRTRVGTATNINVMYQGTGWTLQHAVNATGPWTNLTTQVVSGTNRYSASLGTLGPRRFYRLKSP
jgi:hypothetical protein